MVPLNPSSKLYGHELRYRVLYILMDQWGLPIDNQGAPALVRSQPQEAHTRSDVILYVSIGYDVRPAVCQEISAVRRGATVDDVFNLPTIGQLFQTVKTLRFSVGDRTQQEDKGATRRFS